MSAIAIDIEEPLAEAYVDDGETEPLRGHDASSQPMFVNQHAHFLRRDSLPFSNQADTLTTCAYTPRNNPWDSESLCPLSDVHRSLPCHGSSISDYYCTELAGRVPWPCVLRTGGHHQHYYDCRSRHTLCCIWTSGQIPSVEIHRSYSCQSCSNSGGHRSTSWIFC